MRKLKRAFENNDISKLKYKFLVFDTETTCLEPMQKNFVFGCLYGYNVKKTFKTVEEFAEEFSKKKYKGKFFFAHNAEFDLLTIFGNIFLKIDSAAIFNGKFISAKYNGITFADSMNIYPTSVAKLGDLIGIPKLENPKVKEGKLRKNNVDCNDISYCMTDCEIVYKALLRIFEMTGVVKITLPSLAMYDFRHNYLESDLYFSPLVDDFYESYYGGRTEAFKIGCVNAKVYDVNSLYPAAMSKVTLPDVKHLQKTEKCDIAYLKFCLDHYEGMTKVTVIHEKTYFGYLPVRMKLNNVTKLIFPVGEFTTTVNFNELRFAINAGVVKVKKVFYIIHGNPVESIFTSYIEENYKKRFESGNALDSTIYKLKMNSLYGRFAMKLKMTTTYYEQVPFNLITELKEAEKYYDIKVFSAVRADCFLVTENEKFKNSFFSIPALSSYITSEARILLLKNLIANEKNGVCYCDTDSIFLMGNFIGNVSDRLGDFKLEDKTVTNVKGLKNYIFIDKDGKENIVIKGISRSSKKIKTTSYGETTFSSERYFKTKSSLRQGKEAGQSYTMVKVVRNNYDKREVLQNGETVPLICDGEKLINATKFIRPKVVKIKNKHLHYEPADIREAVILFFANGGKVYTKDLIDHVTGSSKEELKSYRGLHDIDGVHMDVFCEYVSEYLYTDRIIDVFQDVLLTWHKADDMREYIMKQIEEHKTVINKITEYDFEYDTPF